MFYSAQGNSELLHQTNCISIKTQTFTSFSNILHYTNSPRLYLGRTTMTVRPVRPRTANNSSHIVTICIENRAKRKLYGTEE
jgi:hypothetical protein